MCAACLASCSSDPHDVGSSPAMCELLLPCQAAALQYLGVPEVVFGSANTRFGGCGGVFDIHKMEVATSGASVELSLAGSVTAPRIQERPKLRG